MLLVIRKADLAVQCTIGALILISIPIGGFIFLGLGLIVLGALQLISALLNTHAFIQAGFKKQIAIYWSLTAVSLALVFSSYLKFYTPAWNGTVKLALVGMFLGMGLAVYYAIQYNVLINHLSLRNELSGFTKSKF
jgi:hypothetical protein